MDPVSCKTFNLSVNIGNSDEFSDGRNISSNSSIVIRE